MPKLAFRQSRPLGPFRELIVRTLPGLLALLVLSALLQPSSARAERLERLLLGAELRVRPSEGVLEQPRYELTLPHGLSSAHADLLARVGVVLADRAGVLAFPITLGMRWTPLDSWLRPLLGVDLGGYFSQSRGERAQGAPSGLDWTWSARALAGAEFRTEDVAGPPPLRGCRMG